MRLLIAVKSCESHRVAGYHDVIMNTWGRDVPLNADLRFFTGSTEKFTPSGPESGWDVCLGAPDDYMSLPRKTKAIIGWSLWNQYDYTFLCDTDTFIIPSRLVRTDYDKYDYAGRFGLKPAIGTTFRYEDPKQIIMNCHPWASGGIGYFLSRKAAELIVRAEPTIWAEDMFVGQTLGPLIQKGEITAYDIPGFECSIAWHFPRRRFNATYDPKFNWMEEMYAKYK